MKTKFLGLILSCSVSCFVSGKSELLVEAESFADLGGWVLDQQVMDQMGSAYLLAHGLGRPVKDATTTVEFPKTGEYRIWVRTRDWVGQWKTPETTPGMKAEGYPGKFQLWIDGKALKATFGTEKADWHWQDGGTMHVRNKKVSLLLRDLTGFNGRCDAIYFSSDLKAIPSDDLAITQAMRNRLLGFSEAPSNGGDYDFIVVGGGVAGTCAAISAARHGVRVALIQNRPVLGGNNSSEVRVGLSGLIHQKPYPNLGNLVDEIGPIGHWNLWEANENPDTERSKHIFEVIEKHPEKKIHNGGPASNYEDQRKLDAARAEKNLSLFLNTHVYGAEMDGNRITAVTGLQLRTGERIRFTGRLFADCTGDGNLGALANADYRVGRESISETGEELAPEEADNLVMGTSVQWNSMEEAEASSFPDCPWAVPFTADTCIADVKGDWDWETGQDRDQIHDFEHIRDYA
ncbi:MAG: FAD-dependent oxidoreductase, partial [Verrucomicrobiae bacterium]|nr:FAD-dependent oxidoreductase [Verrucomicrobiae bacterium]